MLWIFTLTVGVAVRVSPAALKPLHRVFAVGLAVSALISSAAQADPIPLDTGTAAQSTQLGAFAATNALDDVVNFTHTLNSDPNPTWQVLLPESYSIGVIEAFNRDASDGTIGCCPSRFRDITIQVVEFDGDVTTDFVGGTVVFTRWRISPAAG